MNKKNFDLLVQSMREGAEILHGTREPSRRFVVEKKEDVQQVRQAFQQGRRRPTGAARVLLRIAVRRPQLFAEAVDEECRDSAMA